MALLIGLGGVILIGAIVLIIVGIKAPRSEDSPKND